MTTPKTPFKAMLLAAGEGTRFRPHTTQKPKPALPLLNVPLGFYSFDFLKKAGVESLVVNTFHLPQEIKSLYQSQNWFPVKFTDEKEKILGSGGGLWNAREHFKNENDFFLLNADEVIATENPYIFEDLKKRHLEYKALSTLLVMDHPEVGHKFGGVWINAKQEVIGFGKTRPAEAVHGYHFMGVQILNQKVFQYIPEKIESNILYDALMAGMKDGLKVQVHKIDCEWFETGNLIDYLHATEIILQNFAKKNPLYKTLHEFLKKIAPENELRTEGQALLWADTRCQTQNVTWKNFAVIGKNAQLHNADIEASVVSEAKIISDQKLSRQLIL